MAWLHFIIQFVSSSSRHLSPVWRVCFTNKCFICITNTNLLMAAELVHSIKRRTIKWQSSRVEIRLAMSPSDIIIIRTIQMYCTVYYKWALNISIQSRFTDLSSYLIVPCCLFEAVCQCASMHFCLVFPEEYDLMSEAVTLTGTHP